MAKQKNPTERRDRDGVAAEREVLTDDQSPMDRFKGLARRLVRVKKAELRDADARYKERRRQTQ